MPSESTVHEASAVPSDVPSTVPSDVPSTVPSDVPSTVQPLHPGLFRYHDDGSITLLGGYSPHSSQRHFPRQELCPFTGADDIIEVDLPQFGTLSGWTSVNVAPPGYTGVIPYGLGIVDLDGEPVLKVIGRLIAADVTGLSFGDPMSLVRDVVTTVDGVDVSTWAFTPTTT